jgi:hypothetical protein
MLYPGGADALWWGYPFHHRVLPERATTMSSATLPSRVVTTADVTSDIQCDSCTSTAMTISPNPYFGTGLAVHRLIAECDACGTVAFVPEQPPVPSLMEKLVAYVRSFFAGTAAA